MMRLRHIPAGLVIATLLLVGSLAMALPASRATIDSSTPVIASAPPLPAAETPRPATAETPVAGLAARTHQLLQSPPGRGRSPPPATPTPTPPEPLQIPEVRAAAVARFAPTSIAIGRIGVEARVVSLGVTPEGQMEDPEDYGAVGWYRHGPTPGEAGRAVLAGHLDSSSGPAVFYRLDELAAGDEIVVRTGGPGGELVFVVRETASFRAADVPLDLVYGAADRPELVLITCAGAFNRDARAYDERLIVVAEIRAGQASTDAPGS